MTSDTNVHSRDMALVKRARAGDEKAYELLVLFYQGRLTNTLRQYFQGDKQAIEDVLQETFVKVWGALKDFRGHSNFYTWLFSITINTARQYLTRMTRHRGRELAMDEETAAEIEDVLPSHRPDSHYQQHDDREIVAAALNALPESLREPLHLWSEGFTYQEIADMTGTPLNTVRTRIFRGRKSLAKQLSTDDADDGRITVA